MGEADPGVLLASGWWQLSECLVSPHQAWWQELGLVMIGHKLSACLVLMSGSAVGWSLTWGLHGSVVTSVVRPFSKIATADVSLLIAPR